MKREKITHKMVYDQIKSTMIERGFDRKNTTVLTLLLPLNDFSTDSQLMRKVKRLFQNQGLDIIIVIEPVLETEGHNPFRPNYYSSRYYHDVNKYLPMYHAHVIVKAAPEEISKMKSEWSRLIKCKRDELFRCEPIKKSIPELVNYVTKYFEEKRLMEPLHYIGLESTLDEVKAVCDSSEIVTSTDAEDNFTLRQLKKIGLFTKYLITLFFKLSQKISDVTFKKLDQIQRE